MEGMKLIDASEVITSKKTSKIEIKKIPKSPMKIITEDSQKNTVDNTSGNGTISRPNVIDPDVVARPFTIKPNIIKPDIVDTTDIVSKTDIVQETNISDRTIRAIKLKEDIYYGPKNANKNKFVRMYKKLGLKWTTDIPVNGMMVDGWFNEDKSQYIIKLLEVDGFKRFKFYGCDDIYDYFVDLHGVVFDHNKENSLSSNYLNNKINSEANNNANNKANNNVNNDLSIKENLVGVANQNGVISVTEDTGEDDRFIGADLWSRRRTKQLLKNMPDNWGVIWK